MFTVHEEWKKRMAEEYKHTISKYESLNSLVTKLDEGPSPTAVSIRSRIASVTRLGLTSTAITVARILRGRVMLRHVRQ